MKHAGGLPIHVTQDGFTEGIQFERLKLIKLRQELQIGIDQLNRGEGVPLDMAAINSEIDQELGHTE